MERKFLFSIYIFLCCLFYQGIQAQERSVSGTVTSADDGISLPGAAVIIKGTTIGTQTDFDGNYSINAKQGDVLVFSYVGFSSVERTVGGGNSLIINVQLSEEASQLDEVVVTGYGTQTRRTMATSVSKLDTKVLESASRSNAATALQGTVSGLKVTQQTGQPGATPVIVLRGGTSFDGSGTPLVLIDGVPGSFYALNSDDIESIEVLKDAASTAIYGARAANGVIIVTTKKGKAGRSNINFRSKLSMNQRPKDKMKYLGAADYVHFNRMAVANTQMVQGNASAFAAFLTGANAAATGNNATNSIYTTMVLNNNNRHLLNYAGWQTIEDPVNPGTQLIFMENDMSGLFYQPSHTTDYTLSFDGGNDKGTYYLSLGALDDKGLVVGSGFKRYSGTFNASYKVKDNVKVSSNIIYAHSNNTPPYQSLYNLFQRSAGMAPTSRIFFNNPDGSLSDLYYPGTAPNFGNPMYYSDKFIRQNLEQRLTASAQMDWEFAKNFNLMLRGSYFSVHNQNENFNKAYLDQGTLITTRNAFTSLERTLRNQYTAVVSYRNTFLEKHNVNVLVGAEYFRENRFVSSAGTRLSPTDLIYTLNAGAEADGKPTSSRTRYAIASTFGQLNYDYDDRYLLGATFRRDGTSRLANNKYDFFPGLSVGWNIHNESFYRDTKISEIVSRVKPRVSYGVNGNIEILSNFGVFGTYGQTSSAYDTQVGFVNNTLPLLDLRWERSTTLNMGIDLGLLNNRITIIGDYFIRDVKDKLAGLTLPLWTGFSSITTNNGTLQNKGLELELNAKIIKTEDFEWDFGAVYYRVRNFAKQLPDNGIDKNRQGGTEIYDPSTGTNIYVGGLQQGERVGNDLIVAYVPEGIYTTQAEIDADAARTVEFAWQKSTRFLGDTRWKDVNGDGVIDYRDRVVIGRTTPNFMGGFTSNFRYKQFSLFVKTDYALGHYIINGRRVKGIAQTQGNQNGPVEILNSWTASNPNTDVARFDLVDRQKNHLAGGSDQGSLHGSSAKYWEKGDYLALREITLSCDVQGTLINDIFKNVRVYATGTNLAYFTKYGGSTPEEASANSPELGVVTGSEQGRYPLPRTITLGVNLTF
ncbi:MAG: SusC/RagA family TonB-linked outer membrane protein [Capnocytophaga sp.]|nr:SusC/RagA family TonB-linked outer membrane protein [Capnocytophaga sp.]